jgi:6-pyruvoyltetrahydropterin/6-carboxytetrahydropterin synthase
MYELKTITQFGAAHRLKNIGGKCESLHGHNWRIETCVKGEELDKNGLLVDFKVIKNEVDRIIEGLDHKFLNELEYFKDRNPSSENIARYIFDILQNAMNNKDIKVSRVIVWESDSACATYTPVDL